MFVEEVGFVLQNFFVADVVQEGNEFVAAHASRQIVAARYLLYQLGEVNQNFVAHCVPVKVVDELEVVEVNHQQCACRSLDAFADFLLRRRFVKQSRQRVGRSLHLQAVNLVEVVDYVAYASKPLLSDSSLSSAVMNIIGTGSALIACKIFCSS